MPEPNPAAEISSASIGTQPNLRLGLVVVTVGLLASGAAHGYLDGRWSANRDLRALGDRLSDLPERVGDWTVSRRDELSPSVQQVLRCHGSLVREYVDEASGRSVSVAVLFGPRGPMAVHTPEICYTSVGTKVAGPTRVVTIQGHGADSSFWKTEFIQNPDTEPSFEVWYAWSDGGDWIAAQHPRFWMTDQLFKIQLASRIGPGDDESAIRDFLAVFLPELNRYLATL